MGNKHGKEMASIRTDRFVSSAVSELQEANRSPIYGYQHLPVLSLEEAIENIIPYAPGLVDYVNQAKKNCNQDFTILTEDESAAIYLYTTPIPFFSCLNHVLRSENRNALKPWFAFLKLFITALEKLPSLKMIIWRGVAGDVGATFVDGNKQTWWSVNSCSTDLKVVEFYLGKKGTVFAIDVVHAKDISAYSVFSEEREVVLMPGSHMLVKSKALSFEDRLFIVHLEEGREELRSGKTKQSGSLNKNRSTSNSELSSHKSNPQNVNRSTPNTIETLAATESGATFHISKSLDLNSLERKPFKTRSLQDVMRYSDPKVMCSNDQFLLLFSDDRLYLFDKELELINSNLREITSSNKVLDMTWCASIRRFIVLTEKHAYIFDPSTTKLSSIENIQLLPNERKFVSCTCSDEILYIASTNYSYPSYLHHYSLPDFMFVCQSTVTDLLGSGILGSNQPLKKNRHLFGSSRDLHQNDSRRIFLVRYNRQRLGLIMHIDYKYFLCVVNLTQQPFEFVKTQLPSQDSKLVTLAPNGEWLIICDNYEKTLMQISADCEFKTELTQKTSSQRDKMSNAAMFGPSCLAVLRDKTLELYKV